MTYDEISRAVQTLTSRERLRLAQLLIQLAVQEDAARSSDEYQVLAVNQNLDDVQTTSDRAGAPLKAIDPNRPWVGQDYPKRRIFVLGESYTGTYEGELEYDDAYMSALLAGKKVDGPELFIKMARKLDMTVNLLWNQVAFTNMSIGSIGKTNAVKVSTAQLKAGQPRLEMLLRRLEPLGVLILGAKTGVAAAPVCQRLGIKYRTVYHPTGVNNANPRTACTPEMLQSAWLALGSAQ